MNHKPSLYERTKPMIEALWADIHAGKYGSEKNARRKVAVDYAVAWERWLVFQDRPFLQARGLKAALLLPGVLVWDTFYFGPKERVLRAEMDRKQTKFALLKGVS